MRPSSAPLLFLAALLTLSSCSSPQYTETRQSNPNSAAGKAGQAAHKVSVEADRAARAVGRKLDKAAHDAHAGWKEDAHKDQYRK